MKKSFKLLSFIICFVIMATSLCSVGGIIVKAESANEDLINCKSCILIDSESGTVVFSKDSDKRLPIASMTKLISLGVVFDAVDSGKIKLDQEVVISKKAASTEGSSAFLDAGKKYKVEELIKTVIIASANDSAVALAEVVSGDETSFVEEMNNLASKLGMYDSNFSNSTGLPAVSHYSTAFDMTKIYKYIKDNLVYKKYSNIWMDELVHSSGRKTELVNTNRLIKSYSCCTGGKTGFTNEAGFCLTAAAKKGNMELIGVVIGANDSKTRFKNMTQMFDYGFANYENKLIINKNDVVCEAEIKGANIKKIPLYAEKDYIKFLKKGESFEYRLDMEIFEIKAPIEDHSRLGVLMILDKNNIVIDEISLISNQNIDKIKFKEVIDKIYSHW